MAILLRSPNELPDDVVGCAVAIGNFDGVHRGHASLASVLVEMAQKHRGPSVVVTFDPPPAAILFPDRPQLSPLSTLPRRAELLGYLGVDYVWAMPTTPELLTLSPTEFFQQTIRDRLKAAAMVEGPNFRFGRNRAGDTALLETLCAATSIEFVIAGRREDAAGMISSSRIRQELLSGSVESANRMLTANYQIAGTVADGAKRGRTIGFPTANLIEVECLLPAHGVYAGIVNLAGRPYAAAVNLGPNPTFDDGETKVEVHIIGWAGELYGQHLAVELLARVRDVHRFDNATELREQIARDVAACEQLVHSHTSR